MDLRVRLYLDRAENGLLLAKTNFEMSLSKELKKILNLPEDKTFFNDVISQCYYSIFYTAKAYLLLKFIETSPPEEHKKTYLEFKKFVESGILGRQLLEIYDRETEKADFLLKIFYGEKSKRGRFTYDVNSSANIPHARESLDNARTFVSLIKTIIEEIG